MNALPALRDPVCGMNVQPTSIQQFKHAGQTFYFCCAGCRTKFSTNPAQFLTNPPTPRAPPPSTTIAAGYTCPMHPEIHAAHAGDCPLCGMSLEAALPTSDDSTGDAEQRYFAQRFWWTLPLTITVATIAMFGHHLAWSTPTTQAWWELVLVIPVIGWAGQPIFKRCVQSLRTRQLKWRASSC